MVRKIDLKLLKTIVIFFCRNFTLTPTPVDTRGIVVNRDVNAQVEVYLKVKNGGMDSFKVQAEINFIMPWKSKKMRKTTLISKDEKIIGLENKFVIDQNYEDDVKKSNDNTVRVLGTLKLSLKRMGFKYLVLDLDTFLRYYRTPLPELDEEQSKLDFSFIVMDRELKVNKAKMSRISEVMKKLFESEETSAHVLDVSPKIFKILIYFANNDQKILKYSFTKDLVFDVLKAAKKYQIEILFNYCINLIIIKYSDLKEFFKTYLFAWSNDIDELKRYCWYKIQL
jgi:BTB/POZ domain